MHEPRLLRVIAQDYANFADGGIDAVLRVHKDFTVPETLGNFGSGDKVTIAGSQENKQFHWLFFEPEAAPRTVKFVPTAIQPELVEFENQACHRHTLAQEV